MIDKHTNFYNNRNNYTDFSHIKSNLVYGDDSILEKVEVTISIPTYNRGELLKESLYSALTQVGIGLYAIVVIDNNPDCSDDTILNIIRSINDSRIVYFKNEENIGMFGNQNRCFEIPKSKWVVLLHDDDILYPSFLNKCLKYQKELKCDAIQPSRLYVNNSSIYDMDSNVPSLKKTKKVRDIDNLICFEAGTQSCGFFRRSMMIELGGYNPEFYPSADYCLGMLMSIKYSFYIIYEKLSIYRYEDNASLSHKVITKTIENDYYLKHYIMDRYAIPPFIKNILVDYMANAIIRKNKRISSYTYSGELKFTKPSKAVFNLSRIYIAMLSIFYRFK